MNLFYICKKIIKLYYIICVQMNKIYNFRKLVKITIIIIIIIIQIKLKILKLNLYIIFNMYIYIYINYDHL